MLILKATYGMLIDMASEKKLFWTYFFLSGQKKFFKKEQNHKFLNKSLWGNEQVAKFSGNILLYDIN